MERREFYAKMREYERAGLRCGQAAFNAAYDLDEDACDKAAEEAGDPFDNDSCLFAFILALEFNE
jgi:hypothetical protein